MQVVGSMQWYVLRVAANREMQVRDALLRRVQEAGLGHIIGRIEVPTEQIKRVRGGKQTILRRKLYPGYVFMEMEPTSEGKVPEEAWYLIKNTSGVGDFIGTEGIPTPMKDTEVAKMLADVSRPEEAPSIKVEFKKGDAIKIREGAFENFEGVVDSIDTERGIVKVIVTVFGRSTPLEIEYWQLEKI